MLIHSQNFLLIAIIIAENGLGLTLTFNDSTSDLIYRLDQEEAGKILKNISMYYTCINKRADIVGNSNHYFAVVCDLNKDCILETVKTVKTDKQPVLFFCESPIQELYTSYTWFYQSKGMKHFYSHRRIDKYADNEKFSINENDYNLTLIEVEESDEGFYWLSLNDDHELSILEYHVTVRSDLEEREPYFYNKTKPKIEHTSIGFTAMIIWSEWSECEDCGTPSFRTSFGDCHLKNWVKIEPFTSRKKNEVSIHILS